MPIRVFPPHYQLVYISFDISSFSVISYMKSIALSTIFIVFLSERKTDFAIQSSFHENDAFLSSSVFSSKGLYAIAQQNSIAERGI